MIRVSRVFAPIFIAAMATATLIGCGGNTRDSPQAEMSPVSPPAGMDPVIPSAGPGDTTPVTVQIGTMANISSIHLEMTDALLVLHGGQFDKDNVKVPGGLVTFSNNVRWEMVCPGVRPRGNECTSETFKIDGVSYEPIDPEDFSIINQDMLLETIVDRPSLFGGSNNGVQLFSGTIRPEDLSFHTLGGWGDYFGMFSERSNPLQETHVRTSAGSFGLLHSGYPELEGSATWSGAMVGHTRQDGIELAGSAALEYNFANNQVDLTLSGIDVSTILSLYTYSGPDTMKWTALQVNADGSFYIPGYGNHRTGTDLHPTLGYVDGDFYGPKGVEMAGVFERYGVVGAFGGKRESQ